MIKQYVYKNKRYYLIQVNYTNQTGKRIQRKFRFDEKGTRITTERRAREMIYEQRMLIKEEDNGNQSHQLTFKQWHELFLERIRQSHKNGTVHQYDGDLKKWLTEDFNSLRLKEICNGDLYKFIYETLKDLGATLHTQKRIGKNLRRILEAALDEGLISHNPARSIKVKVPPSTKYVLNTQEAQSLLENAKLANHPFYEVWAFALLSGMRSGEMYGLRWNDIDLVAKNITISHQWTSKDGYHSTKSNKNRVVPISRELKSLLISLKVTGPFTENLKGRNGKEDYYDDLVLPRLRGWKSGEQARILRDFCQQIGITSIKFHDLRATFITNLLSQGVSLVKVMSIVGHSKMSTTDEYLRLAGVNVKGATDELGYSLPKIQYVNLLQLVD